MFQLARLKLTAWYLLIIILVSGLFSVAIYAGINQEYTRLEKIQRLRQQREQELGPLFEQFRRQRALEGSDVPSMPTTDLEGILEARRRLQAILLLINFGILGLAGIAGYFLAGRTLKPIQEMVDEQNRFITDASHELRTPLTSLKSEIEVNLRDRTLKLKDSKKLLESNLEEVNKLQYLSDNLIKLTQYQKINGNIIFERVSLREVSEEAVKKVVKMANSKNITIKNNVKDEFIKGDRQSLIELLVILLDNATKYSPKNTQVKLGSKITGSLVEVEIKDQGPGIDKVDLPHLFDRFYRADKSRTKTDVQGYGLGLSIAKQIAEKHQGMIKVESEPSKGTTFSVQLPLAS